MFGVSLGNHALTLLMAPGVVLFVLAVAPRILWQRWRLVLACLVAVVATTVLVYAYLPIRSAMDPPLDYAHPADWIRTDALGRVTGGFRYLVLGEQFRGTFHEWPSIQEAADQVWGVIAHQLGGAAPLALLGRAGGDRAPAAGDGAHHPVVRHPGVVPAGLRERGHRALLPRAHPGHGRLGCAGRRRCLGHRRRRDGDPLVPSEGMPPRWLSTGITAVAGLALLLGALAPVPGRFGAADASDDTWAREWVDALLPQLEPDPVVISWWSYSTPLWYERWARGQRPDMTIIDDRDVLDDGLGDLGDVIAGYLDQERPVYLIRLDDDLPPYHERFELEEVPDLPGGSVWHVVQER